MTGEHEHGTEGVAGGCGKVGQLLAALQQDGIDKLDLVEEICTKFNINISSV